MTRLLFYGFALAMLAMMTPPAIAATTAAPDNLIAARCCAAPDMVDVVDAAAAMPTSAIEAVDVEAERAIFGTSVATDRASLISAAWTAQRPPLAAAALRPG